MLDLKGAQENLYAIFQSYTIEGMQHCDCGCIDELVVRRLYSKPLRELLEDDMAIYHGKAVYTWGELEHYKHFLPRFFEIYSANRNLAIIDLYLLCQKLESVKWTDWPIEEVKAIKDFVLADWIDYINNQPAGICNNLLENYFIFFRLEQLLPLWNIVESKQAIRNFVLFYYYSGNLMHQELKTLIYTNNLTDKLQEEFFDNEQTDREYAEKVSVVLQMIEQQIMVDSQFARDRIGEQES